MPSAADPADADRSGDEEALGALFAVGGAEDKIGRRTVLRRFVEAAGGSAARVLVVPTASSLGPEIVEAYDAVFRRLGAAEVTSARPATREEAHSPELVERVDGSTGVFMTGGNQLTLGSVVVGTPFGAAVVRAHRRGAAVGGTSAGASILAEHMVAFGSGGSTPKQRMSQLSVGLGLLPEAVVDQHFEQRNRYGRLLSLVAQSPSLLGLGIDEDTAAVVTGGRWLEVVGRGAVTVVDGSTVVSNASTARRTEALLVSGAVLHVLPTGSRFDLRRRILLAAAPPPADVEVVHLRAAEAELRRTARRIAAEGAASGAPERSSRRRAARRAARSVTEEQPVAVDAPAERRARP
ncbi:MAG TPA: cyanophycinase [Jiangellales bacterium]|nr:cyanophycinase [Jiangellales bacterium]